MDTISPGPYIAFGELLAELRRAAGLAQQSDLAVLVKTSQQTVSRWEAGISRPRDKQLPLLARVLKVDLDKLLAAAGYTTRTRVATYVQPFWIDALTPDNFERFCLYFISAKYPTAKVHRVGGQGHTQGGLDIEVIFDDGTCHTFQCKRVDQFGPAKVHVAVAKHTRAAEKKYLLLSRIASPQARQAIRQHEDWDIWDQEDISRIIRQTLSKESQLRLVDTFFRGQRLSLLGETEAGPWQTSEEFFAPFVDEHNFFNHDWQLVGRDRETSDVVASLSNSDIRAILLVGTGGSGKSRVLKQAVEIFEQNRGETLIRFLSPTESVTRKSLDDLGQGSKLLIVDDAHDRDDLQLLFQYASNPANKTTILLAIRSYGLDYIKGQAGKFALLGECVSEIKLDPLNLEKAKQLATQVLEKYNGPISAASDIARLTFDCPLFTIIGARVVAEGKVHLELIKNEDIVRSTLMGKFQDIIAGDIGSKSDAESIRKVLKILALVQPFHPEDESIAQVVERVEGLDPSEVNRLIRLLTEAGVLFKRGDKCRLSPDLLADYIIENSCIRENGKSTGYAEQVFDAANNTQIEHVLVNLGKLDWRRANGDPRNSGLLDGIWQKLEPSSDKAVPFIGAVTAVAYYQPTRALDFAENLMREGLYLSNLPNLIKYAAYNFDHLQRSCEYLWELGRSDNRALHQHPDHAIRILSELCSVEPGKSTKFNKVVVDFGLSLLRRESSWGCAFTPFDVLSGILQVEGHTTESSGRTISLKPFLVSSKPVSVLRISVIDAAISLLLHSDLRIAVQSAKFLHQALRYPMGIGGMQISQESHDAWTPEFVQTLGKIRDVVLAGKLDPLVIIELVRSVNWHADFADGATKPIASQIIEALPEILEFRITRAFIDGFGHLHRDDDYEKHKSEWEEFLATLVRDLQAAYPDGEKLRSYLEVVLTKIERGSTNGTESPGILYWKLLQVSYELARATALNALQDVRSRTNQFAGIALAKLLEDDHDFGLSIAQNFMESESIGLQAAVGRAYSVLAQNYVFSDADFTQLQKVLSSNSPEVAQNGVQAIRWVAKNNKSLAKDLIKCVDVSISSKLADEVLMLFQNDQDIPFQLLTDDDIDHFLKQLMLLPELNGFWIDMFLSRTSKYHAQRAATFFMDRVERTVKLRDSNYYPHNRGSHHQVPLLFRESVEYDSILGQVVKWMNSETNNNTPFKFYSSRLFETMFSPFDSELIGFILKWIDKATSPDYRVISQILQTAQADLVFKERAFVLAFLEKAHGHGRKVFDHAVSALYCSAIAGGRSGIAGEPFPQDIKLRDDAVQTLHEIPRFAPAYRLYEYIKSHADESISRSIREREQFEDE